MQLITRPSVRSYRYPIGYVSQIESTLCHALNDQAFDITGQGLSSIDLNCDGIQVRPFRAMHSETTQQRIGFAYIIPHLALIISDLQNIHTWHAF